MIFEKLKEKFSSHGVFAKNSLFLFVGSMVANILNYVYHLVIGRQVSAEIYGEAEALISLIAIVSVPAATLAMVATKYAAACKAEGNKNGSREIWSYLNKKVFKYGLPVFFLAIILTPLIGKFLNISNNWALIAIWIVMYVSFFNSINSGLLGGWQKFKKTSLTTIFSTAVKLFSAILLVGAGFALNGIVGSLVLATIAAYAVSYFALNLNVIKKTAKSEISCESKVDFDSLRKFILPVFIGNLAITILGNADMILAKHGLNALEAGQYGALTVVSKIIFFGTGILASVLFSMSAEKAHKGEHSLQLLKIAAGLVLAASAVATFLYFAYPAQIMNLLFGNKYLLVAPYLGWFAISVTLFSISNVIFQYLLSIHKTKIVFPLLTISLVMALFIVLLGNSISAIISIVIVAQTASIIAGIVFLFNLKTSVKAL